MWPFRKLRKTYLINKPVNEIYEQLKKITDYDSKERSSITGGLLNIQPIEFEFYAPFKIKLFRAEIFVTLKEEKENTRINTIVKGNFIFLWILFALIAHIISSTWSNDTWFDIKGLVFYIIWFSIAYFGDWISKSVIIRAFENSITKAHLL